MSRLLFALSTLVIVSKGCQTYCDSFGFPAIYYEPAGKCYATIGGADPFDTANGCEYSEWSSLAAGWVIAAAEADTIGVANAYPWGTHVIVFGYPDTSGIFGETFTGTANFFLDANTFNAGYAGFFVLHQAPNDYKTNSCYLRVLISTACPSGPVTPAAGEKCGECVADCSGLASGDYASCLGCDVYASCSNGILSDGRPCPGGLVWDDSLKICNWESHCVTGPCQTENEGNTPPSCSECVEDCDGVADGDYMSCQGCDVYASCSGGVLSDNRLCPATLVWNDATKNCGRRSTCNGGACPAPTHSPSPSCP